MNDELDPIAPGTSVLVEPTPAPTASLEPPLADRVSVETLGATEAVEPTETLGATPDALVPLAELAPSIAAASVSRRRFLGFGLSVAAGLAGAAVLSRLFPIFEDATAATAPPPITPHYDPAKVAWTFVVDTNRCIGCGQCVVACKTENHVPEGELYNRTWVERHVVTADAALYVDSPAAGIHGFPPESTAPGAAGKPVASAFFEPRLCMQCEESPCTSVCPVGATYRTPDGVILVDARRCIGCGYCVTACPYGARYIVPAGPETPQGIAGVADKCTWCYHRLARGLQPACVEICPVGARRFGDRNDATSEIARIVREQKPEMLHPEYGTRPRVLYVGPATREA
jgi:tetrathionate reductase subunit B